MRPHGWNDSGSNDHRGEHDVGCRTKQRGSVVREYGFLVKELANPSVGEPDARCPPVLQPGPALIDPAEKQGGGGESRDQFERLSEDFEQRHNMSESNTTSVTKL